MRRLLSFALMAFSAATVNAENDRTELFWLHKFQQPIGTETDLFSTDGQQLSIESTFKFTDRGSRVPLKARLKCARDYTPVSFSISGSTSRSSTIDETVEIRGNQAKLRNATKTTNVAVPGQFFTVSGYAPVVLQEALVAYWQKHGKPVELATLPPDRLS